MRAQKHNPLRENSTNWCNIRVSVDEDLSDFGFPYLDDDGRTDFLDIAGYEEWLNNKKKGGEFIEDLCKLTNSADDVDREVLARLKAWGYV